MEEGKTFWMEVAFLDRQIRAKMEECRLWLKAARRYRQTEIHLRKRVNFCLSVPIWKKDEVPLFYAVRHNDDAISVCTVLVKETAGVDQHHLVDIGLGDAGFQ